MLPGNNSVWLFLWIFYPFFGGLPCKIVDFPKFRDGPVYAPGWDSGRRDSDSFRFLFGAGW